LPNEVTLPPDLIKAVRRRTGVHNHPKGGGPSIRDITTGIATAHSKSVIIAPYGKYTIDFGNISKMTRKEREKLASDVYREIRAITDDITNIRRDPDDVLDEAISAVGDKYGFSVNFEKD
jgi:hypothetical protein